LKGLTKMTTTFLCTVLTFTLGGCGSTGSTGTQVKDTQNVSATASPVPAPTLELTGSLSFDVNHDVPEGNAFTLPSLIADHMVLQRNRSLSIWGSCKTDGDIAVIINGKAWAGKCQDGNFAVTVGPLEAGGPYDVVLRTATEKTVVKDVLFGDVYLCSGQSNMAMSLDATKNGFLSIQYANQNVRCLTVEPAYAQEPQDSCKATWKTATTENIKNSSAVAVIYGNMLQKKYNIPIGVIISCVGGTMLSTWLPKQEAELSQPIPYVNKEKYPNTSEPSMYYNGMIYPLRQLQMTGVVWYQGEGQEQKYGDMLTNLIAGWRREFEQKDLYFVIIQLPRYDQGGEIWAQVREQQALVARKGTNIAYSVNIDCGEQTNIHPLDKEPVGIRAAQSAMSMIYQEKGTLFGPTFKSFSVSGDSMIIQFENVGSGLVLKNGGTGFQIRGAEGGFQDATATVQGNTVILRAAGVTKPEQAQYCFKDFPQPSLFNQEGLPCEPFRTKTYSQ